MEPTISRLHFWALLILGRFAMTCCAEDLSMSGFVCDYAKAEALELDDWVKYSGIIDKDYIEKYDLWYSVIYVNREPSINL